MSAVTELLIALIERVRRRPAAHWMLRLALAACGLAAQGGITLHAGASLWTSMGVVAVAAGVALPRTVVPLLAAALLILQAAAAALPTLALVPVAVALLGWHTCATLLSMGRPWARVDRSVRVGIRMPVLASLGTIAVTAAAAAVAQGLDAGEAGILTVTAAFAVVFGAIVVLWPAQDAGVPREKENAPGVEP